MTNRLSFAPFALAAVVAVPSLGNTYTVTNTNDVGAGSLRQAILNANANPGVDQIEFNIPGGGVQLVLPASPLPAITETVSMDGWTQPSFAGTPVIEIGGDIAGAGSPGLVISNNSSQIRGLVINNFSGIGIYITGSGNASIYGCYIGLNNDGIGTNFPIGIHGIFIDNSPNNDIGGTVTTHRNIISNCGGSGVYIAGAASTNNIVRNNYIGTDVTGNVGIGNDLSGIRVENAPGNTIGGTTTSARNVVSANIESGIRVVGFSATGNVIQGNRVGTNASGTAALGNDFHGIYLVDCDDNTVGGTVAGAGNLVSANANDNIRVQDCGSVGSRVQGNLVGLNASGSATLGSVIIGVSITRSSNCLVGGPTAGARNVIAGHGWNNIEVITFSTGTVIENNFLGTDISGLIALGGGGFSGLEIFNVCKITVRNNVVSGHTGNGIGFVSSSYTACSSSNRTEVVGNKIGVGSDGITPLGNGENGIEIYRHANSRVGSIVPGQGNIIANNIGSGILMAASVYMANPPANAFEISGNSIYNNGGLGIDLSADVILADGVTPNDPNDSDTGTNNFQNYPLISSAVGNGVSNIQVFGTLDSLPSTTFRIELFRNPVCDPSGYGEGRTYLSSFDVTTNASGDASFSPIIPVAVGYSEWITATARNLTTNDTSEFSLCRAVTAAACGPGAGNCYINGGNGTIGCDTGDCCDLVCDIDPFCCNNSWDNLCAQEARQLCAGCGTLAAGDPYQANGSAGCWDDDCCAVVCAIDPYCCNVTWDNICANIAIANCTPCPGDVPLNSPGVVDVSDLLALLAAWGNTGVNEPADIAPPPGGDGIVNVNDLLLLLASWGACP